MDTIWHGALIADARCVQPLSLKASGAGSTFLVGNCSQALTAHPASALTGLPSKSDGYTAIIMGLVRQHHPHVLNELDG